MTIFDCRTPNSSCAPNRKSEICNRQSPVPSAGIVYFLPRSTGVRRSMSTLRFSPLSGDCLILTGDKTPNSRCIPWGCGFQSPQRGLIVFLQCSLRFTSATRRVSVPSRGLIVFLRERITGMMASTLSCFSPLSGDWLFLTRMYEAVFTIVELTQFQSPRGD